MQISIRSAASLMQIISTAFEDTGRSGKPERLFFFPEGRTYSPPRRRKLHIPRPAASGWSRSFRCSSSPHKAGFAGTPWQAVVSLLRRARALFANHPPDASQEGSQCRNVSLPSLAVRLADRSSPLFAASLQTVVPCLDNLPTACENLPPQKKTPSGSRMLQLYRSYGRMLPRTVHFLLIAPKETKTLPAGSRKGSDILWQSITLKLKS